MKKILFVFVAVLGFVFVLKTYAADKTKMAATTTTKECKWSDPAKMKTHLQSHVKYPATGAAVKETCKKEMPNEFTATERTCFEGMLADTTTYNTAGDVMAALKIK